MNLKVPPPVVTAIAALIMWSVASLVPALSFAFPGQGYAAGLIAICGLAIGLPAIRLFRKEQTTVDPRYPERSEALVVNGIYRFTRNPMYVGFAFLLVGWMVWLGNPANTIVLAGFVAYITRFQIMPEEAALSSIFGDEYTRYRSRVRRWL